MAHGERLGPLDHVFLHVEDKATSMHIASLAVFEGPIPAYDELREALRRKLPLVPRYRQRITKVPLNLARPVWTDHRDFDIDAHLRRVAVAAPGGEAELAAVMSQEMSEPLPRELPLWSATLVEGIADGHWGVITKIHHAMADGISGMDLLSTIFDSSPEPDPVPEDDWQPQPQPSAAQLLTDAVRERATVPGKELRAAARLVTSPRATLGHARTLTRGLAQFATAARPIAGTSLIGPIHRERLFRWAVVPIADVLEIKQALGGTINDVVLAAVTRAHQELLVHRGDDPTAHAVRTLVPVSVRHEDGQGVTDNRVSAILVELPVDEIDPVRRMEVIHQRMKRLKHSHEADAGEAVTELSDLLPPPLLAAGLHMAFRVPHRVLATVTTNVPGPRQTLYLLGRKMLVTYPQVPIADRIRVGVAVTSYDGDLAFGITADASSTPDVDVFVDGLKEGFAELRDAAEK